MRRGALLFIFLMSYPKLYSRISIMEPIVGHCVAVQDDMYITLFTDLGS